MKNRALILAISMIMVFGLSANLSAQSTGASIDKKVGLYVYPAKGQSADQQNTDESDCYTWAVQQSGYDPINPATVQAQQVQQGPDGAAVRGSAGGAAAGAAIGAISGDAGKGAAYGAIAGALMGRRRGNMEKAQEQQQNNTQAQQTNQNLVDGFKKAYTACLTSKGYTVN